MKLIQFSNGCYINATSIIALHAIHDSADWDVVVEQCGDERAIALAGEEFPAAAVETADGYIWLIHEDVDTIVDRIQQEYM